MHTYTLGEKETETDRDRDTQYYMTERQTMIDLQLNTGSIHQMPEQLSFQRKATPVPWFQTAGKSEPGTPLWYTQSELTC